MNLVPSSSRPSTILGLLDSEDKGTTILQNISNYSLNNTASHLSGLDSSVTPSQNSNIACYENFLKLSV
jgi:hypothetical protein